MEHVGIAVDYDPLWAVHCREVPTTEPQREIWLADQFRREASLAFNLSVSLQFRGELNLESACGALQTWRTGTRCCAPCRT
jgi:hypothetical protein